MSDNVKKIVLKLRFGHPVDVVPARLSDDTIVNIDKIGVVISAELYSTEMRESGLYEVEDWKESLKEHSAFVADTAVKLHGVLTAMRDSGDGSEKPEEHRQDADGTDAHTTVPVKETAAQKRARVNAEKKAAKEAAEHRQDADDTDADDVVADGDDTVADEHRHDADDTV